MNFGIINKVKIKDEKGAINPLGHFQATLTKEAIYALNTEEGENFRKEFASNENIFIYGYRRI